MADDPLPLAVVVEAFTANLDSAFNVAHRVTWNRADALDVVQNAFVKAALARDQVRDARRLRSWLLTITFREALALVRARRDVPTDPSSLPEDVDMAADPALALERNERVRLVRDALIRLPESLRVAVVLRDMEDLAMAEVADVLGVGVSAAKMRVSRGREWLRVDLAGRI